MTWRRHDYDDSPGSHVFDGNTGHKARTNDIGGAEAPIPVSALSLCEYVHFSVQAPAVSLRAEVPALSRK